MRSTARERQFAWTVAVGVCGAMALAMGPAQVCAEEAARQVDKIGNIELTDENYQKLAERAKRMGRDDLAEQLLGEDRGKRLEAARQVFNGMRRQGAGGGFQGGGGPGGFGGGRPGPGEFMQRMGGRMPMMPQVVVTTTEKYLFIVRGDQVFQLDVDTLEILNQVQLPGPQPRGPRTGRGGQPPQPPAEAPPAQPQ